MSCARRTLPDSAFDYARERLWLARGLGRYLAQALVPGRCLAWTLAAPDVQEARLARLSEAGRVCDDWERSALSTVAASMARHAPALWVVPDPAAAPGDPLLADAESDFVVLGDGVYYVERARDADRIRSAWRSAGFAAGRIGLVTTEAVAGAGTVEDELRRLASAACLVVLEAYDGEGAVFFEPAVSR